MLRQKTHTQAGYSAFEKSTTSIVRGPEIKYEKKKNNRQEFGIQKTDSSLNL